MYLMASNCLCSRAGLASKNAAQNRRSFERTEERTGLVEQLAALRSPINILLEQTYQHTRYVSRVAGSVKWLFQSHKWKLPIPIFREDWATVKGCLDNYKDCFIESVPKRSDRVKIKHYLRWNAFLHTDI